MNSINLYMLKNIKDVALFNKCLKTLSNNINSKKIKSREINSLYDLIEHLDIKDIKTLDGFYVGYEIPHIGHEFDLLKFSKSNDVVLNIELKSELISLEKIKYQLLKNKLYLSTIKGTVVLYTYVIGGIVFKLQNNELVTSNMQELVESIESLYLKEYIDDNIDKLFKPSDFLISPVNDIDRFINKKYFLTPDQIEKKNKIIDLLKNKKTLVITLSGKAGTGKTLLAYNIAVDLMIQYRVLILFCGDLNPGHNNLNAIFNNIDIKSIKEPNISFVEYGLIIIDEIQRITDQSWKDTIIYINHLRIPILLVGDEEQYLSQRELNSGHFTKTISNFVGNSTKITFKLTNKIRTNKALASYIKKLFDYKNSLDKNLSYEKIQIVYANNVQEAKILLKYYVDNGYIFINYTSARQGDINSDVYRNEFENIDAHHVLGQEFDNVVVFVNENFGYMRASGNRELLREKDVHPTKNYIYRKMLFQALTRARDKIAIIVVNNIDLFEKINNIKFNH